MSLLALKSFLIVDQKVTLEPLRWLGFQNLPDENPHMIFFLQEFSRI